MGGRLWEFRTAYRSAGQVRSRYVVPEDGDGRVIKDGDVRGKVGSGGTQPPLPYS